MHEYSLAKEIANIVKEKTLNQSLVSISLKAGILSGVFPDSLSFYLELIFQDLGWKDVTIHIESVPAKYTCHCGKTYTTEALLSGCPDCGQFERSLIEGDQCIIETLEVK